jgi:AAA+ ATPase superfamily predicted ATPase
MSNYEDFREMFNTEGRPVEMTPELFKAIRSNDAKKDFNDALQHKFQEAKALLLQKHEDYGPTNISRAPGGALNGLRVRMHDKQARINHLMDSKNGPKNESLRDSFLDLANYAIIALMVLDGDWPEN